MTVAEKLKVIVLGAAVRVVAKGEDGKGLRRLAGFNEAGEQVFEPATRIVFLDRGDELPDDLADGEAERLKALDPPAVGTQADLDWFEERVRGDTSTTPSWALLQTSYPGVDEKAIAPATAPPADLADLAGRSDQELVALYEGKQPTVKTLLAAVGDDPVLAQRVLDAESTATKGDVRATLKEGLDKVIADASAPPEEPGA